ncbi:MAG TPA: hypothetical protein VEX68_07900 [Bryobacteraceae bacterium]|nr:hypothetical protein [Bryobacteraceae bacterium]
MLRRFALLACALWPLTLRAQNKAAAGTPRAVRDVFQPVSAAAGFAVTLRLAPVSGTLVTVYVNGLLYLEGGGGLWDPGDYTVVGRMVTFKNELGDLPLIQCFYTAS